MSGYAYELLRDYARGKLSASTRMDIRVAIHELLRTQQMSKLDLYVLELHLRGYSCLEIDMYSPGSAERLSRCFALIADASGYTDEAFISTVLNKYPKFKSIKPAFLRLLELHGRIIV